MILWTHCTQQLDELMVKYIILIISWPIKQHPVMEMYTSLQFQGAWQDKFVDERLLVRGDLYR